MGITIRNINGLKQIVDAKIQTALTATYDEINDTLEYYIDRYYDEYKPKMYDRTNTLLDSPIELNVTKTKGGYACSVGFSDDYLNYQYPDTYVDTGTIPNIPATGLDVVAWNDMYGSHGYTVNGKVQMWSDTIDALGGRDGIIQIFKRNLRACGLPIQ